MLNHPDPEQLLLRVLGLTLVVAALAELVHVGAAVGAFLVGLSLSGESAERAGAVLAPLRDRFAAIFFVAIGTVVVIRGEFSLVVVGLVGAAQGRLGSLVAAYVIALAVVGPVLTRYADRWTLPRRAAPRAG